MDTMNIPMTAQIPSGFALPVSTSLMSAISGSNLEATTGISTSAVCAAPTYVVRDRVAGDALAKGAFPGPTAWSPPTC